ncbi:unnamed protein product [marine sediment metagenome]|uniref:Uncharacterized protein n=1 Tax=marine sediment metagenome TaxID=412755 RepID=X1DP14_9ZZZZ
MKLNNKPPKVTVFVGRTASGFNRFLVKNTLSPIDPDVLAEYVVRAIQNFKNDDIEASNLLLQEIWALVRAEDAEKAEASALD